MTDWNRGYVTEVAYTYGFYREWTPGWLDWVALLHGVEPPHDRHRVVELGCGQGFGLCVAAAANPHHHFIGLDFNPAHIAHANALARRTGLSNIEFQEADFIALAAAECVPWERCDYVIAHGILSWVNAAVRQAIFRLIDRTLAPGGLAYFSYNSLPGWLGSHPAQHLMRQFATRGGVNTGSFQGALEVLQGLRDAQAVVFNTQPGLGKRLEQLRATPPEQTNYLYHEYFNDAWSPFYSTDVVREAAQSKLHFVGTATLPENFDQMLPEPMRALLARAPDAALRELYKDLLINQSFRRDVFVRGGAPIFSGARLERLGERAVTLLKAPAEIELKVNIGFGEAQGREEIYRPLLEKLAAGARTLRDLAQTQPQQPLADLVQPVSLLAHSGALGFAVLEAENHAAIQFNQRIAEAVGQGAPYLNAALPGIGSGYGLNDVQWLALNASYQGVNTLEAMINSVASRLQQLGKVLHRDGQPITPGEPLRAELATQLTAFINQTVPLLRRLGGVK